MISARIPRVYSATVPPLVQAHTANSSATVPAVVREKEKRRKTVFTSLGIEY